MSVAGELSQLRKPNHTSGNELAVFSRRRVRRSKPMEDRIWGVFLPELLVKNLLWNWS